MSESPSTDTATVVLVHGAFADASSWTASSSDCSDGRPVIAPANPLRGIAADSAYLGTVLAQIDGPGSPSATPTAAR